jgi:AraC-like DNA-binding protein
VSGPGSEFVDEYLGRAAAPALRSVVGGYTGYRQRGVPPVRHRGLPSPWITVILTLDDPLVVLDHPDPRQPGGSYLALVGGLHTRAALIAHGGRQSGLQVALHPLGARALLTLPAGELAGLDVHGEEVLGPDCHQLREQLSGLGWPARFDLLDRFFTARLADVAGRLALPSGIAHACRSLARGNRVADVAREVGWSTRHLSTLVRRETGLSPRDLIRVARFDRARRALQHDPRRRIADVAAEVGCYDASHLVRDFHEFAGSSPGSWLDEEFRSVQDTGRPVGAGSPHG